MGAVDRLHVWGVRRRRHDQADDIFVFQVLNVTNPALARFAIMFCVAGFAAGLIYRAVTWSYYVSECNRYRAPGVFMAYCGSDEYGDYEHGAYYYDLEPEAVKSMQAAKVVFV